MNSIIDADLHHIVPNIDVLLPYMEVHWQEYFRQSHFRGPIDSSYPKGASTSIRPTLPSTAGTTRADVPKLDPWQTEIGILNCTYEVESLHNPDMAATCARAVNEWQAEHWLAEDSRLRASIVAPSKVPRNKN